MAAVNKAMTSLTLTGAIVAGCVRGLRAGWRVVLPRSVRQQARRGESVWCRRRAQSCSGAPAQRVLAREHLDISRSRARMHPRLRAALWKLACCMSTLSGGRCLMRLAMNNLSINNTEFMSPRLAVARGPLRMRPSEQMYACWRPGTARERDRTNEPLRGYFCES